MPVPSSLADKAHIALDEVVALRAAVASEGRAAYGPWRARIERAGFISSALNLAHYLAVRHRDLRPLQRRQLLLRRQLDARTTVVLQAVLFGLVHGSIFRLLPTFALGLVLGFVRLRTGSIWPGVLIHALNNGILIAIQTHGGSTFEAIANPTPIALAGVLGLALGLTWIARAREGESPP